MAAEIRTGLDPNGAAADIELSQQQLDRLDELFPPGAAAGDRYADMSVVER